MIKITKARGFLDNESYRKETWFELDGITGYCIREEGKYYPEISASIQIVWNGSNISYNGEYTIIEGYEIPSDRHLKELSDEFEPSIYDSIKSDNNELY
jgi:hypothetical protein